MKATSGAAQNNSEADHRIVMTSGEVFSDGKLIELVEPFRAGNLQLLYWSGERATIATEINYEDHLYRPIQLDPTIRKAMSFSGAAVDYGEPKALFQKIVDLFQRYIGFDEPEAKLLVLWVFSTWVADCLPSPLVLLQHRYRTRGEAFSAAPMPMSSSSYAGGHLAQFVAPHFAHVSLSHPDLVPAGST
jgi:hypothetical protein